MYSILCGEYREKAIQQMKDNGIFLAVFQGASLRFHLQAFFIENADGYSDLIVCQLHAIDDFVILHVDDLSFFSPILYTKRKNVSKVRITHTTVFWKTDQGFFIKNGLSHG